MHREVSGPWLLEPARRRYAWGSARLLPELLGEFVDGEPLAELWFGAHPAGSALVPDRGGESLASLVRSDTAVTLGERSARRHGDLPFMVKLIAAGQPLSIQTHPSAERAAVMFAAENERGVPLDDPQRRYQDARAKPEIVCAVSEFDALIDFRPVDDAAAVLDAAGLTRLTDELRRGGYRGVVRAVLAAEPTATGHAIDALVASGNELASMLAETYPCDPGVIVAMFLNRVRLAPGQAAFLSPGSVHAYLSGLAVEVMATSDNVLRAGLTSKFVDVDEFLIVARLEPGPPDLLNADDRGHYQSRSDEFALVRHAPGDVHTISGPAVVLCTDGSIDVGSATLAAGHGAFVPAAAAEVAVHGTGQGYIATVGSGS